MRRVWLWAIVIMALVCAQGCTTVRTVRGLGQLEREERAAPGATGVHLAAPGELTIQFGERPSLVIEAERNLLSYYETTVENGVLRISTRMGINLVAKQPARFVLTLPQLDTVVVSGSGKVRGPSVKGGNLAIKVSGSGDARLGDLEVRTLSVNISGSGVASFGRVTAERVDVEISGSGRISAAGGEAASQTLQISGSGDYHAKDLISGIVDVRVSGSGDAEVYARERLNARLSGSGNVRYRGAPVVDVQISGTGKAVHIDN